VHGNADLEKKVMLFKNIIFATLITVVIIFTYIKSVEAKIQPEFDLPNELLDKTMAVLVLGGIDYYVDNCTELTPLGIEYRNEIISYHDINADLLPINPGYIKGALSVSVYDCQEMFELVNALDVNVTNLVIEPI
tara:strand:+ start:8 stop:412 length:405 start_codon:yes stop_codon:yes gene_type:complete